MTKSKHKIGDVVEGIVIGGVYDYWENDYSSVLNGAIVTDVVLGDNFPVKYRFTDGMNSNRNIESFKQNYKLVRLPDREDPKEIDGIKICDRFQGGHNWKVVDIDENRKKPIQLYQIENDIYRWWSIDAIRTELEPVKSAQRSIDKENLFEKRILSCLSKLILDRISKLEESHE